MERQLSSFECLVVFFRKLQAGLRLCQAYCALEGFIGCYDDGLLTDGLSIVRVWS